MHDALPPAEDDPAQAAAAWLRQRDPRWQPGGRLPGCGLPGGQLTGGQLTGGPVTGGPVTGGPVTGGQVTDGRSPGGGILGVVLGSGLSEFADQVQAPVAVAYRDVPGMAASTAAGHRGAFLLGHLGSTPVIAMAGRLHVYEGHGLRQVTHPIRVLAAMGVDHLIVSCAAGGLNPRYAVGDLAVLDEHLSWLGDGIGACPMRAARPAGAAPPADWPHPPVSRPPVPLPTRATCHGELSNIAMAVAQSQRFTLHRGTYLAVNGPNYETRAECRMMRAFGVDLVGMSTVPEVITAARLNMSVLALAVVTNVAYPDAVVTADHTEVLAASKAAGEKLQQIVLAIAESLRGPDHDA